MKKCLRHNLLTARSLGANTGGSMISQGGQSWTWCSDSVTQWGWTSGVCCWTCDACGSHYHWFFLYNYYCNLSLQIKSRKELHFLECINLCGRSNIFKLLKASLLDYYLERLLTPRAALILGREWQRPPGAAFWLHKQRSVLSACGCRFGIYI